MKIWDSISRWVRRDVPDPSASPQSLSNVTEANPPESKPATDAKTPKKELEATSPRHPSLNLTSEQIVKARTLHELGDPEFRPLTDDDALAFLEEKPPLAEPAIALTILVDSVPDSAPAAAAKPDEKPAAPVTATKPAAAAKPAKKPPAQPAAPELKPGSDTADLAAAKADTKEKTPPKEKPAAKPAVTATSSVTDPAAKPRQEYGKIRKGDPRQFRPREKSKQ